MSSEIVEARVIVTCPDRNFVTLKITTDDGVTGVGDATLNGRELAVASYLTEHVCPLLVGRAADRIEDTWQYLYRGAYWRRGPVTMAAIGAVDVALWDIAAKTANMPLYKLLGGRSREGVTVYGHASAPTIDGVVEEVGRFIEAGYRAVRVQCAVPGLQGTYGVSGDRMFYEPASRGAHPAETSWSSSRYLNFIPTVFDAVRARHGFDVELLHDVHHRLTPIEAARLGRSLEEYALYWMEDPIAEELQEGFRLIRQHTTTPIAVGEVYNSIWDCERLITHQLIDFIRTPPSHAGGVTHARRIFALADLYHVRTACHGATDLSPVSLAASLHVGTWVPNFGLQEYMRHTQLTDEVFPHTYRFEAGMLHAGEGPGLGVEIDEDLAARHPYQPAYLPVARLVDGTVHDW